MNPPQNPLAQGFQHILNDLIELRPIINSLGHQLAQRQLNMNDDEWVEMHYDWLLRHRRRHNRQVLNWHDEQVPPPALMALPTPDFQPLPPNIIFPATIDELINLSVAQTRELLVAYGQPHAGNVELLSFRLCAYITGDA